ncbi:reverse transcriptase domain-containing protein [Tanacetum coccineum]
MIASDDVEYSYALRLNFSNSSNDAEYEALLAGLRIATEMFRLTHIPRVENRKADALSKLAVVQFDHLSKEVLPSMHRDARELIRACDDCQAHTSLPRLPKADMILVTSAWPFIKWGMDIVGPLSEDPGRVKYLIVKTDYFTKWMEAKPLATITGKQVKWAEKLKIQLISTSVYHPQWNGAVERANRSLLRGIKTKLENGGPT